MMRAITLAVVPVAMLTLAFYLPALPWYSALGAATTMFILWLCLCVPYVRERREHEAEKRQPTTRTAKLDMDLESFVRLMEIIGKDEQLKKSVERSRTGEDDENLQTKRSTEQD